MVLNHGKSCWGSPNQTEWLGIGYSISASSGWEMAGGRICRPSYTAYAFSICHELVGYEEVKEGGGSLPFLSLPSLALVRGGALGKQSLEVY